MAATTVQVLFPQCPICHNPLEQDLDMYALGCGHIMCSECVNSLYDSPTIQKKCPMCRHKSSRVELTRLYIDFDKHYVPCLDIGNLQSEGAGPSSVAGPSKTPRKLSRIFKRRGESRDEPKECKACEESKERDTQAERLLIDRGQCCTDMLIKLCSSTPEMWRDFSLDHDNTVNAFEETGLFLHDVGEHIGKTSRDLSETITSVAGALKQMQTGISSVIELVEEKKTLDRMLFYAKTERSEQQKRHQKDMDYHLAMWEQKSLDLEVKEKELYRKLARGKEELQSSRQTLSQKDKEVEQLRNDLESARTDMAKYLKRYHVAKKECERLRSLQHHREKAVPHIDDSLEIEDENPIAPPSSLPQPSQENKKGSPSVFSRPIILAPKPGSTGRRVAQPKRERDLPTRLGPFPPSPNIQKENRSGNVLKKHGSLPYIPVMPVATRQGQLHDIPSKKQRTDQR